MTRHGNRVYIFSSWANPSTHCARKGKGWLFS